MKVWTVLLGLEPAAAESKAQMNPLSYDGTARLLKVSSALSFNGKGEN